MLSVINCLHILKEKHIYFFLEVHKIKIGVIRGEKFRSEINISNI